MDRTSHEDVETHKHPITLMSNKFQIYITQDKTFGQHNQFHSVLLLPVLCILTSQEMLRMPFAGHSHHIFGIFNIFTVTNGATKEKFTKKEKVYQH